MTGSSSPGLWLFSARTDLLAFTGPVVVALLFIAAAPALRHAAETPPWLWVAGVLLVDVAHVWSTLFVTYLNPAEFRRHLRRYVGLPLGCWAVGVAVYSAVGATAYWSALAYLAVFHFVRQQQGWLALYRARFQEGSQGRRVDSFALYAATLYPLLWWHAHLPRHFTWFVPGDFLQGVPQLAVRVAQPLYALALLLYAGRAVRQALHTRRPPWGKHLLVAGTALTWYVGIVATNSDAAFTLSNVLTHGIPYAVLVFHYARYAVGQGAGSPALGTQGSGTAPSPGARVSRFLLGGNLASAALRFVACLWLLAYAEELLWDQLVWQERPGLFGSPLRGPGASALWVPLLSVPQLTHYLLDGLVWRKRENPTLSLWFRHVGAAQARNG